MDSVRVLIADDVFALLTVVDDVVYLAPMGSDPFDVARPGVWHVADVRLTPIWTSAPPLGELQRRPA